MWRGMNESAAKDADGAVRVAMTFLEKRAEARDTPRDWLPAAKLNRYEHPFAGPIAGAIVGVGDAIGVARRAHSPRERCV